MRRPSVEVTVAGQSFRVVASEGEEAVRRYAAEVQERLQRVGGGRQSTHPQAMLLAAMALAHELEQERASHAATRAEAAKAVESMLERVDSALDGVDDDGKRLPAWRPVIADEDEAAERDPESTEQEPNGQAGPEVESAADVLLDVTRRLPQAPSARSPESGPDYVRIARPRPSQAAIEQGSRTR